MSQIAEWRNIEESVRAALVEVDALVQDAFARSIGEPPPDSPLRSLGLKDGREIVTDYLDHNELGIAFEHLLYMVTEMDLQISPEAYDHIDRAGRAMEMNPDGWQSLRRIATAEE